MCCRFFNRIIISWVTFGVWINPFCLLIRNWHRRQIFDEVRRGYGWIDSRIEGHLLLWRCRELLNLAREIAAIVFVKGPDARFQSGLHLHLILRRIHRYMLLRLLHRVGFLARRRIQEVKLIAIQSSEIELDLEQTCQDLRREVWKLNKVLWFSREYMVVDGLKDSRLGWASCRRGQELFRLDLSL